jgi:hypothetical protein
MRLGCAALAFPICVLAVACGGSTSPTGPSAVQVATPQTASITLSGSVRDASNNAPLPGTDVQIASGPDASKSTATDAAGNYTLTGLRLGVFTVRVTRAGYEIAERTLSASGDVRLDLQLRPGPSCRALPPPTGLRASVQTSRVTFSWNAVEGRYDYILGFGPTPGSTETLLRSTTDTSYLWRSPRPGTYYARVGTRSGDCTHTDWSNEITFTFGTATP